MSSAAPLPVALADLRPKPVSGHLQRVNRQSGDRWRAKWRDAAGVEHLRVLGRVWTGKGRPREGYLTEQQAQAILDELLVQARKVGPGARRRRAPGDLSSTPPSSGCATSSMTASAARPRCAITATSSTTSSSPPSARWRSPS